MNESKFLTFGKINQPVNSWLCMILLGSICLVTLVYFFAHINDLAEAYVQDAAASQRAL